MKATIKLYEYDGASDYGFPVKLIISHNKKIRRRIIGFSPKEDWEPTSQLPLPSHDDFEDLYTNILDLRKKAAKMEFQQMHDLDAAIEFFMGSPMKQLSFYDFADQRINSLKQTGHFGNARVYEYTIDVLKLFKPNLTFKEITPTFVARFKEFKKADKVKNSTLQSYLRTIRAIYNSGVKQGQVEDIKPFDGAFKDIKVQRRRAKNHYLDEERIKLLENASFPDRRNYELAKDLVLLQFYLCGLDLYDINYLKKNQIQNGRVFVKRGKLGENAVEFDVLLPEKAKLIIERWQDPEQEIYVFDFPKGPEAYKYFRDKIYRNLQRLKKRMDLKLLPKDSTFTLKVMRHSFGTLGKFKRYEEDLLRELMGHERDDVDTIYKDKYPETERDAAQLDIIG